MTGDLSDADYHALARFRYALRLFLRFSEEAAAGAGLTPRQHQLLLTIRGWDGDRPASVSDIAERLQLRVHSTVELLARAEEAGLVVQEPDPDDGRRRLPRLTPTGAAVLADLTARHKAELATFRQELRQVLDLVDPR